MKVNFKGPINPRPPLPLRIPRALLGRELREGDIVTLGSKDNPARDIRTGIPMDPNQQFRVEAAD